MTMSLHKSNKSLATNPCQVPILQKSTISIAEINS